MDLTSVAPSPARGVATLLAQSVRFLFEGPDAVQTGVTPGALVAKRTAVIRGRVRDREGDPLTDVQVSVVNHPEVGSTTTRTNGIFDIVANGGAPLTLNFEKPGFFPAHRRVEVPWQDFVIAPEVVLVPLDPVSTAVNFGGGAPFQTAQSSMQSDADGTRHTLMLFAPGTLAGLVMPDGTTQSVSGLHIRATEFTVGDTGIRAMPALLPPLSGYTYCVELSADEALAAGATGVVFSQPILTYVENFLKFPVGTEVPVGIYDRERAVWIPSANGRVVVIVDVTGGLANVDSDGDGLPDERLGMSTDERRSLASVYAGGQSLWRVPVRHFSPEDSNWPFSNPDDSVPPADNGAGPDPDEPVQDANETCGCLIDNENQALGESVPVAGTPFTLNYRSDRVARLPARRTIRLSGASVPASLASIDLRLAVAGREFVQSFPAAANLQTTFVWDGQDAYGRRLLGGQTLTGTIDYNYPTEYQEPGPFPSAFNQPGGATLTANPGREQVRISSRFTTTIGEGLTDARALGLGGWSLSAHQVFDPVARVLHSGSGERRRAGSLGRMLTTIDVTGQSVLFDVASGPDGSALIALPHGDLVVRVEPDGSQAIVAGNGTEGFSGDGGTATEAMLGDPTGIAIAPDGSLYISEESNYRIRKVSPQGIISTFAGNGVSEHNGDGGPATQASVSRPERIALGPDSSLYVIDGGVWIRRITGDGIIQTIAGIGVPSFSGDDGPATDAAINCASVAVAGDGSYFIADFENHRVRRVGTDGIIRTVASYLSPPGTPVSVALTADGGLLVGVTFSGGQTPRVDLLKTDGSLVTVAGGGATAIRNGIPATQANLESLRAIASAPDGSFFIVPGDNGSRMYRVGSALPGYEGTGFLVASPGGGVLYVFDEAGRHLETRDALTGAALLTFHYDEAGLLTEVLENTGSTTNTTVIRHDAAGTPTEIVSPFGQVSQLAVDNNGFLKSVTNPAGEHYEFESTPEGLLTSVTDPRGAKTTYAYDPDGRLLSETDPSNAVQILSRSVSGSTVTVTRATPMQRVTTYAVNRVADNVQQRTITDPDGGQRQTTDTIDAGATHATFPDGTVSDAVLAPDPRFGMEASFVASSTLGFPSGLHSDLTRARQVTLSDPRDPLSLQSSTETTTVNGQTSTVTYTATDRSLVALSSLGRRFTTQFDVLGRVVRISGPGIDPAISRYDDRHRLAEVVSGSGANARTNTLSYDTQGFLETFTDPLGRTVRFDHDPNGRVTRKQLPDGRSMSYVHDEAGNLTRMAPPGRPEYAFTYDGRNLLTSVIPPQVEGSGPTLYARDADRALTLISRPGGRDVRLAYDNAGRLVSKALSTAGVTNRLISFEYDSATRQLSAIAVSGGIRLDLGYDGSLLTRQSWSGAVTGMVTRVYDAYLRIASEAIDGTESVPFEYDGDGLLTRAGDFTLARDALIGRPTGGTLGTVIDTRTFDSTGHSTSFEFHSGTTPLFSANQTRDGINRVTRKSETVQGTTTTVDYGYDGTGRLTDVTIGGAPVEHYEYDENGNRTNATVRGVTIAATYDAQDRLLRYGNETFTYAGAGELLARTRGAEATTYRYDEAGTLVGVRLPDGTQIDYLLDGMNRRLGKRVNDALVQGFVYDGQFGPVAELDGTGAVRARFIYAGGLAPAYLIKDGTAFRIITDPVGSVRLVVNAQTGEVVQRMDYDAFGNVLADTQPGFQPFGFAGGLYDRDTGLVLLGARSYNAESGRWTTQDPLGFGGLDPNLYRYARNDPVNGIDPLGYGLLPDVIDDSLQDPWDFYGGIVEGALDLVVAGGVSGATAGVGLLPALVVLNYYPILDPVQAAFESDLVDTQSDVFKFGRLLPAAICPEFIGGEAVSGASAAGELQSEATQIVRVRQIPIRPFAPTKIEIVSPQQAQENIGQLIDALFDIFPGGGPVK